MTVKPCYGAADTVEYNLMCDEQVELIPIEAVQGCLVEPGPECLYTCRKSVLLTVHGAGEKYAAESYNDADGSHGDIHVYDVLVSLPCNKLAEGNQTGHN